ncbi:MAG: CPBP family intramembrane metalloprotease [Flavobacteriaceae bacterium]|nr:CPBP family intramembrane metalloprotease [Flavobacteriaceae bacterium]
MIPISKYGLGGIIMTCIAILITFIAIKKDKKTFKDIGFQLERKTPVRFTIGFFVGILITIIMLIIIICFSNIELIYNVNSNIPSVLFWLLAFFPLAFMEEIIFRGYAFTKINKALGLWPAQILLALLFAWYHDFTGLTFYNQLLGPGIWALIYGIAVVWSKGLAFPTGLHMAINVVLALVGQKDDRHALWNLEYANEITPALRAQTENIGLLMQISILMFAIVLTEHYRRNKLKPSN